MLLTLMLSLISVKICAIVKVAFGGTTIAISTIGVSAAVHAWDSLVFAGSGASTNALSNGVHLQLTTGIVLVSLVTIVTEIKVKKEIMQLKAAFCIRQNMMHCFMHYLSKEFQVVEVVLIANL